jgi:hypothetical protein
MRRIWPNATGHNSFMSLYLMHTYIYWRHYRLCIINVNKKLMKQKIRDHLRSYYTHPRCLLHYLFFIERCSSSKYIFQKKPDVLLALSKNSVGLTCLESRQVTPFDLNPIFRSFKYVCYKYCHVIDYRRGLDGGSIASRIYGTIILVNTNNYDILTELRTPRITSRCLVAAFKIGRFYSSGFQHYPRASATSFSCLTTATLNWLDRFNNWTTIPRYYSRDTNRTENVSSIIACSLVSGETKYPESCSLSTSVYRAVTWQWVYTSVFRFELLSHRTEF